MSLATPHSKIVKNILVRIDHPVKMEKMQHNLLRPLQYWRKTFCSVKKNYGLTYSPTKPTSTHIKDTFVILCLFFHSFVLRRTFIHQVFHRLLGPWVVWHGPKEYLMVYKKMHLQVWSHLTTLVYRYRDIPEMNSSCMTMLLSIQSYVHKYYMSH